LIIGLLLAVSIESMHSHEHPVHDQPHDQQHDSHDHDAQEDHAGHDH
jgi:hypothetical protein